jgi:hypothetical protein
MISPVDPAKVVREQGGYDVADVVGLADSAERGLGGEGRKDLRVVCERVVCDAESGSTRELRSSPGSRGRSTPRPSTE